MKRLTIAIDGPAGAGKSTIARGVAEELGYTYIDTGAMYRSAAWYCLQRGVLPENHEECTQLTMGMRIRFETDGENGQRVYADEKDVTLAIRSPEVTRLSSPISAIPAVRRALVAIQQNMGANGGVVMEGRDIGTVVFPDAEVKVFLTASEEERARRRWLECTARGENTTQEEILYAQRERDMRDSSRADSPLAAAHDAVNICTDDMTIEQVLTAILDLCRERGA